MKQPPDILVCDDDDAVRSSLGFLLGKAGFNPVCVADPGKVPQLIREQKFALVLLDMNFSLSIDGEEGIDLLRKVKVLSPLVPVILITAWGSVELAVKGMKMGAADFVTKPWNNSHLLKIIETSIKLSGDTENYHDDIQNEDEGGDIFQGIIGKDPALLDVMKVIRRVAPTNAPVLITGESGTGKEMIASAIHKLSSRKENPFIKVNLGGIPSALFESEMFGYTKGAFTDAKGERAGRFERADKGTIFLDEIGDLSHSSQVKLLRVLQDQTFEKLGDSKSMTVDVRILSATNKDIVSLVEAGSFREDLLYRINLIHIDVPPLRKRKNDIPVLADYFAGNAAMTYSMDTRVISDDGKEWLSSREWPGNIRELKNLVERTVLLTSGDTIKASDLIMAAGKSVNTEKRNSTTGTLDDMERSMIVRLIEECGGNLSKASEKLGISRTTLYRKMDKYNIQAGSDE